MTLAAYLKEYGLTDAKFAEMIGVSRVYITHLRTGKRTNPSNVIAAKIARVTDGKVPGSAWFPEVVASQPERAA